jgi:nucleoside-diphosphate-sugar epimerase
MDYWGMPNVPSHMPPLMMVLDIPNNTAVILGSGDVPVIFTHTRDVARFVTESLDLDKWDPESYVMGDKVTFNELLRLAEDAKGKRA